MVILLQLRMNKTFIKSKPEGDFKEVSALLNDWEIELRNLAARKLPIQFDMYPRPNIPEKIQVFLSQHGYHDHILENDRWQHFLISVPNSQTTAKTSECGSDV